MDCRNCGCVIPEGSERCVYCGEAAPSHATRHAESSDATSCEDSLDNAQPSLAVHATPSGQSTLAVLFVVVGCLDVLGGILVCAALWPPAPPSGYESTSIAYVPALAWLVAGLVSALFAFTLAALIWRLDALRWRVESMQRSLSTIEAAVCKTTPAALREPQRLAPQRQLATTTDSGQANQDSEEPLPQHCPFCKRTLPVGAVRCFYCERDLSGEPADTPVIPRSV